MAGARPGASPAPPPPPPGRPAPRGRGPRPARPPAPRRGQATATTGSSGSTGTGSSSGLPAVTLAATDNSAALSSADNGTLTFTRTGATTAPLTVKFALTGTAVKWIDYRRPEGDMPVEFTI